MSHRWLNLPSGPADIRGCWHTAVRKMTCWGLSPRWWAQPKLHRTVDDKVGHQAEDVARRAGRQAVEPALGTPRIRSREAAGVIDGLIASQIGLQPRGTAIIAVK